MEIWQISGTIQWVKPVSDSQWNRFWFVFTNGS